MTDTAPPNADRLELECARRRRDIERAWDLYWTAEPPDELDRGIPPLPRTGAEPRQ